MNTLPLQPWYRHRWPWLLMIGPACAVLGGVATLWLALISDDGLVAEDYYKQGMAINRTLSRERAAQQLGLHAAVRIDEDRVQVALTSARGAALPPALRLRVVHPTRAMSDQNIELQRDAQGAYTGIASAPSAAPGARTLILEDAGQTWRLTGALGSQRPQRSELRPNI
jgi:hypothetical protein